MYSGLLFVVVVVYYLVQGPKRHRKRELAERAYRKQYRKKVLAERDYIIQLNPTPFTPLVREKRVEYIVNNRKIPCAFERYYYIKLNMPLPVMTIEPSTIERHYHQILLDNKLDVKALNDVEAAKNFFNDRMYYLSQLN